MPTKPQHRRQYSPVMDLLREMREEAELTQRELGERIGKPQSWVHNCETGNRRVDVGDFCDWCDGCGVDPLKGFKRYLAARPAKRR